MAYSSRKLPFSRKLKVVHLVRRYWAGLAIGFVAVLGETLADVLEPWPIKIVVDSILQSKKLPPMLEGFVPDIQLYRARRSRGNSRG